MRGEKGQTNAGAKSIGAVPARRKAANLLLMLSVILMLLVIFISDIRHPTAQKQEMGRARLRSELLVGRSAQFLPRFAVRPVLGFAPGCNSIDSYPVADLPAIKRCCVITSTPSHAGGIMKSSQLHKRVP